MARDDGESDRAKAERALARRQRSVRRYTAIVRWLKILLPLGALALVALIFVQGRDRGTVRDLFTAEELARLGAGLRLEAPRFAGVTEAGEPFVVIADWAMPDQAMPEEVALENPRGEIGLEDGRLLTARADAGLLVRSAETLTLSGDVVIETSDGYRVVTGTLDIDFGEKTATASGPVHGTGPSGSIDAGSFRASSGTEGVEGAHIWFENRVRVLFIPAQDG